MRFAAENKKGRRLYVAVLTLTRNCRSSGTWEAIAASGKPDRLELFRKVLLASASIPRCSRPYHRPDDGRRKCRHQEMHVDGGVFFQSFSSRPSPTCRPSFAPRTRTSRARSGKILYVLRNGFGMSLQIRADRSAPDEHCSARPLVDVQGVGDQRSEAALSRCQ